VNNKKRTLLGVELWVTKRLDIEGDASAAATTSGRRRPPVSPGLESVHARHGGQWWNGGIEVGWQVIESSRVSSFHQIRSLERDASATTPHVSNRLRMRMSLPFRCLAEAALGERAEPRPQWTSLLLETLHRPVGVGSRSALGH